MINHVKNLWNREGVHKKIIKGSATIFIMSLVSGFIGYFIRVISARTLTLADYGLFYSIFTLISLTYFLKDMGISQAVAKYIPEFIVHKRPDRIKTIIVIMLLVQVAGSIVLSLLFFFTSDWLALHYFKNPAAAWLLKIMILYIIFSIVFKLYKFVFQGYQKMFHLSLVEPLKNLAVLIVLILFVDWLDIKALALGYILSTVFVGIILLKPFLNIFPSREKIVEFWPLFKKLILFGLPVILTAVGGELISYFDTFALTYFRSLEEVGIYQVILPTATMVLMLGRSLAITIYPMISEYWAKKEYYVVQNGIKLFYKLVPLLVIPLIIGIFLVKPFLGFFFGAAYLPGVLALQILLVGVFFYFIAMINTHALAAIGLPKENAKLILMGGLINVILNIILIPSFGIEGAAFATAIAYIWIMVRSISKVKRFILDVQPDITTV